MVGAARNTPTGACATRHAWVGRRHAWGSPPVLEAAHCDKPRSSIVDTSRRGKERDSMHTPTETWPLPPLWPDDLDKIRELLSPQEWAELERRLVAWGTGFPCAGAN